MAEKKVLIVIDMQNDFIDGALGTREAEAIVQAAAERIRACRRQGYTVFATLDTHGGDYLNTSEGKKLPVPHCVKGTRGWQINSLIADALGDYTPVEKPTFGSTALPALVAKAADGADQLTIELMGLCTDICVVSNALMLKAHFPEAHIAVHAALCAGVTPQKHAAALETMQSCQIDLI